MLSVLHIDIGAKHIHLGVLHIDVGAKHIELGVLPIDVGAKHIKLSVLHIKVGASQSIIDFRMKIFSVCRKWWVLSFMSLILFMKDLKM